MPFKIVETNEKGKSLLFTVPSLWESKGVLRWPKNRSDVNKLVMDENCMPSNGWTASRCRVKRQSISTFAEAERELSLMLHRSDTDTDDGREIQKNTVKCGTDIKNKANYNVLAEHLIFKKPAQPSTSSASLEPLHPDPKATNSTEYIIQYVDESEMEINSANMETYHNEYNEAQIPIQNTDDNQQNTDDNQIVQYLKKILQNQKNIEQNINKLESNQAKIFQTLASLSVQVDDGFSMQNPNKSADVVTLSESKRGFDSEAFIIKPIGSILDLEKLESLLLDKQQRIQLLAQYSFVCPQSDGKGATCAYRILDMFFTREFLCKCSWTGGSRKSEEVKIGLKKYKNVLNFYFELIHSWDSTFTHQDNENFFKTVLKNSGKRMLSKNERASTKRRRIKKGALKTGPQQENLNESIEENQNAKDQEENLNNKETNEEGAIENIRDDAEIIEEEEIDEESLC